MGFESAARGVLFLSDSFGFRWVAFCELDSSVGHCRILDVGAATVSGDYEQCERKQVQTDCLRL